MNKELASIFGDPDTAQPGATSSTGTSSAASGSGTASGGVFVGGTTTFSSCAGTFTESGGDVAIGSDGSVSTDNGASASGTLTVSNAGGTTITTGSANAQFTGSGATISLTGTTAIYNSSGQSYAEVIGSNVVSIGDNGTVSASTGEALSFSSSGTLIAAEANGSATFSNGNTVFDAGSSGQLWSEDASSSGTQATFEYNDGNASISTSATGSVTIVAVSATISADAKTGVTDSGYAWGYSSQVNTFTNTGGSETLLPNGLALAGARRYSRLLAIPRP